VPGVAVHGLGGHGGAVTGHPGAEQGATQQSMEGGEHGGKLCAIGRCTNAR